MNNRANLLWVDKHRPIGFDKFLIHTELSKRLKSVVSDGDFPNLLFHGPSGSGKKTLIMGLLREVFGNGVNKLKLQNKDIDVGTKSKKIITITTLQSQYHIEVNPSDSGNYDRFVVSKMIKEIAQSVPINVSLGKKVANSRKKGFKVVILNEADFLSPNAQSALRRTMENYSKNCKVVLCCSSISRILDPIRSRCLCIRVPAPEDEEIGNVLDSVARNEGIQLNPSIRKSIIDNCDGNLRRAILSLETEKVKNYPFNPNQQVDQSEWDKFIMGIATELNREQSPRKLLELRQKYYTLLVNCIPADLIFKRLCIHLCGQTSDTKLQFKIIKYIAEFETRMKNGTKPIYHLEAFSARYMKEFKSLQ